MLDIDDVWWTWFLDQLLGSPTSTAARTRLRHVWMCGWPQPLVQNHVHQTSSVSNMWPKSSRLSPSSVSSIVLHEEGESLVWGYGGYNPQPRYTFILFKDPVNLHQHQHSALGKISFNFHLTPSNKSTLNSYLDGCMEIIWDYATTSMKLHVNWKARDKSRLHNRIMYNQHTQQN